MGAANNVDANKIQTTKLLQDAHMLRQLQQSYDIDQFLNNPSPVGEATIDFANNITQALGDALRSTPYEDPSSAAQTPKRPHRRPKRLSRHNTANSTSSVGGSSVSRKTKRCYQCGVTDTPRWQGSGFGSRLLCNVCGLLHSKRIERKHIVQFSRGDSMSTTDSAWS
ncbi:transcription factor [Fusarium longipes]|uniref:Transcription factor n=1 Tax=Fusarium longipes TaxID=694270 RepID=A0A395T385_9HYPO|nr:transcription factor [Fusarium longipes]